MKEQIEKSINEYISSNGNLGAFVNEFPSELAKQIVKDLEENHIIITYPIQKGIKYE